MFGLKLLGAAIVAGVASMIASPTPTMAETGKNPLHQNVLDAVAKRNAAFSSGKAAASGRIAGGKLADPNPHRFQVGVLDANIADNYAAQYCGGTLFKEKYVITAAHCVFQDEGLTIPLLPEDVHVLVKTRKLDGGGLRVNVTNVAIHPDFAPLTFDYDVAILTLETNVLGLPTPKLIGTQDPPKGKLLQVTGWGDTKPDIPDCCFPVALRKVSVPVAGRTTCNDKNSYEGEVTPRMFCAGYTAGGKDSCVGDSGGPIVRKRADGSRELVGIVSWGIGCAEPNFYGIYTRISNASIKSFILTNTP
jgi:secreted trypsin-like serine protease